MLMLRISLTVGTAALALAGFAPAASAAGPVYQNCQEAHSAGVFDIPQGDPAYWLGGDRDKDGYACDSPDN